MKAPDWLAKEPALNSFAHFCHQQYGQLIASAFVHVVGGVG